MANSNRASRINPGQRRWRKEERRFGIYMGEVVSTKDVSRTGRIRVYIAAFGKDKSSPAGSFDCIWVSPFAGSTDYSLIESGDTESYEGTHQSYGMWMVPPDVGNIVLVAFGDGSSKYPLCMGCLFPDHYNHMVPGIPSGTSFQSPGVPAPVAEKNKFDANTEHSPSTPRPIHHDFAEVLTVQGLINDTLRGPTSSGAKREVPSQVFGILTPGPEDPVTRLRKAGHQLIMDDSLDNRQIRFRSAGGGQILIDDTTGTIYCINSKGTAWFEMTPRGGFNFFAEDDINFRSKRNFSVRADRDINLESGGDFKVRAAGDTSGNEHVGTVPRGNQPTGYGGNIRFDAAADITQMASLNHLTTAHSGDVEINAAGRIAGTSSSRKGIQFKAARGPLQIDSKLDTTISAQNFLATTSEDTNIQSAKIYLNSGGATAPAIRNPAVIAPGLETNNFQDQASTPPRYDRTADDPVINGGRREVTGANIESIVASMPTAEPFEGHTQFDPLTEIPGAQVADQSLSIPNNAIDAGGPPADVDTPSGFSRGLESGGLSRPSSRLSSNFDVPSNKNLSSIPKLPDVVGALQSSIPSIRTPTTGAGTQSMVGMAKVLRENEVLASQFAIDRNGLPADLTTDSISKMTTAISATSKMAPADQVSALSKAGIQTIQDGDGTIYRDKVGNNVVDFKNGIGPVGSNLGLLGDMKKVSTVVDSSVRVPLSDNQYLSLISFATHIGESNFAGSTLVQKLNQGKYEEIPNEMQKWRKGPVRAGGSAKVRDDYIQRRQFEAELFATPDWVNFDFTAGDLQTKSFAQLRHELQVAKGSSDYTG